MNDTMQAGSGPMPDRQDPQQPLRLLEAAFRSVPFALYLQDRASGYEMTNPLHAELCEFALRPRADTAILDGRNGERRDRALILAEDARVLDSGEPLDLPAVTYLHSDGRATVHHVRKLPLRDAEGSVFGLLKVVEDVTEQRRTEQALRKQQRLLQAVFDVLPVWVFVKDLSRRFVLVNRKMAAELGLPSNPTPAELATLALDVTEEDARLLAELDQQVIESGESVLSRPITVRAASGENRLFRTLRTALRDEVGRLSGIVGFAEDVTEQVLANQALRQRQKLDTLGMLAGGLAHDFNNLLMTILGTAETERRKLSPEQPLREALGRIELAGQRAAEMCRQVLSFAGKGRLVAAPTDLNALARETAVMLHSVLAGRAETRFALQEPLPLVHADRSQLQQVLMNLIINAAQAVAGEGGLIVVKSQALELRPDSLRYFIGNSSLRPGPFVQLQVHDNGSGMSADTISRIFDPFFTTKQSGNGLGLAAALGIVSGHGGALRVESRPGEGTTFFVVLPVCRGDPAANGGNHR